MKRLYCKSCGKMIGYETKTNVSIHGMPMVEHKYTHCRYKSILTFPNAKPKPIYTDRLICDYCNNEVM